MKKTLAAVSALVVGSVGLVAFATASSAHTPNVSADCNGLNVNLASYGEADVAVVVNGVTDTFHVSGNGGRSYAFPQDGTTSTWSVSVDETRDGDQYDASDAGTVGPCGVTTPPTTEPPTTEPPTETPTVPTETPTVPVETPTVPTETPSTPVVPEEPTTPPVETRTRHLYTCTSHTVFYYEKRDGHWVELRDQREKNTFESTCAEGSNTPNPSEEGF